MLQAEQILQNRYQLIQKLGENTARQTWLANDLEASTTETKVVVKLLAFGGQVQWDNLKLFEREAQVLKQLNHPRIPKYRDDFCIDDRWLWFGLVEEYIPGSSFKELLSQGKKFNAQEVRKIAVDVVNILVYLHQLSPSVLHRDIKPSNLILGENEQVYLIDFGAVQDKAASEGATFTVVGTYGYTPMEQFGGRAVPASDLYALGATLIHLLTGTAPADLPQRDLRIHFSDRISASPRFVAWIEKLTEPAPERRFSNASLALAALKSGSLSSNAQNQSRAIPIRFHKTKVHLPPDTRVKLNKSPVRLEIKIPLRGIKSFSAVFMTRLSGYSPFTIILTFILLIILPQLIIWLWVIGLWEIYRDVNYFFGSTQVNFNRESFEIKRQLFNLTYFRRNELTRHIQDVSLEYDREWEQMGVTITLEPYLNHRFIRHSFGRTLTDDEIIWLEQEIRDWLEDR